jgi:hypothetical protein
MLSGYLNRISRILDTKLLPTIFNDEMSFVLEMVKILKNPKLHSRGKAYLNVSDYSTQVFYILKGVIKISIKIKRLLNEKLHITLEVCLMDGVIVPGNYFFEELTKMFFDAPFNLPKFPTPLWSVTRIDYQKMKNYRYLEIDKVLMDLKLGFTKFYSPHGIYWCNDQAYIYVEELCDDFVIVVKSRRSKYITSIEYPCCLKSEIPLALRKLFIDQFNKNCFIGERAYISISFAPVNFNNVDQDTDFCPDQFSFQF